MSLANACTHAHTYMHGNKINKHLALVIGSNVIIIMKMVYDALCVCVCVCVCVGMGVLV